MVGGLWREWPMPRKPWRGDLRSHPFDRGQAAPRRGRRGILAGIAMPPNSTREAAGLFLSDVFFLALVRGARSVDRDAEIRLLAGTASPSRRFLEFRGWPRKIANLALELQHNRLFFSFIVSAAIVVSACAEDRGEQVPRNLQDGAHWIFANGSRLDVATCKIGASLLGIREIHVEGEIVLPRGSHLEIFAQDSDRLESFPAPKRVEKSGVFSHRLALDPGFARTTAVVYAQVRSGPRVESIEHGTVARLDADGRPLPPAAPLCLVKLPPYVRTVDVPYVQVVHLDGHLDEQVWQRPGMNLVDSLNGWQEPRLPTATWLAWNREALYIAAKLRDDDLWSEFPPQRDEALYQADVFEIFLAADGSRTDYLELGVAPTGAVYDGSFSQHRVGSMTWNGEWEASVRTLGTVNRSADRDQGWQVEVRVPWSDICTHTRMVCPIGEGARLRLNLFRLEKVNRKYTRGWALNAVRTPDFHAMNASSIATLGGMP
jgi:hypothetical protein